MEIGTRYEPKNIESTLYKKWVEKGYFTPKMDDSKPKYSIVIPPPNITGRIHMGHALNITIQDILSRYKRMLGYDVLWLPGEDHAGIATQNAVEKHLASQGKHRHDFSREEFLKIVWDWANKYRKEIKTQIMSIGASVDWTRERFTLDEGLSKAVRKVFVRLYKEGLIYKGKYIVNWCHRCGTVLADDEVDYKEEDGKLYYIKYPLKDSDDYVVIATTRPETMLGDTAIAVHPSDDRHKDKIGKVAILPLVGRELPIIADNYVDPSFGTGALKVTPAHDPNDYLIGQRHKLESIEIFDEKIVINENGGKYKGLDAKTAREVIVRDLEEQGYLIKIEPLKHSVGRCYRCDTVIEPRLMDQWFVSMKPLAERAIKAVEDGEVKFVPERWKKIYLNWMYEIRDWCISRQLWWGHRIPVWQCQDCGHYNVVEEGEPEKCEKCGSVHLKQEEDVLDTWFSSALWPFSTLGWPEETQDLKRFYPTDTLVTGFDIIFFWVARMIMMGYKFMDDKPFKDVYIHQLVRDKYGRKMSKSLGNGIDPLEVIDQYGADPMRFTLAILAVQGRDLKLDVAAFDTYKKFANKIWNATRFVIMNLEDFQKEEIDVSKLKTVDKWILTKLQKAIKIVTESFENYDFNIAVSTMYSFFWDEFCDWYIEAVKPRLKTEERVLVQNILVYVLDNSLKLLHPIMPFITEELWTKLPGSGETIVISDWPKVNENFIFEDEEKFEKLIQIIRGIRNVRADVNIPPASKVNIAVKGTLGEDGEMYVKLLANVDKIDYVGSRPSQSATAYISNDIEVYVPLEGLIDFSAEVQKVKKKVEKLSGDLEKFEMKLSDEKFINNAPIEIVEETKKKYAILKEQIEKLQKILKDLEACA